MHRSVTGSSYARLVAAPDMLHVRRGLDVPLSEVAWRATTPGGPGGQHANRTLSRVEVQFDVAASAALGPRQRARLLHRLGPVVRASASESRSQARNRQLALDSGVPDAQIALGDAFEIDLPVRNSLLYEWAQAQLTRELFPDCPVKYMPPTRHMDGNLFRTHACDALFNLVTIATGQGIQTIGVPTEGIFTPHIHDRVLGLQNVDYVFNAAHDLGEEIEFKRGGIIQTRAQRVLAGAHELLEGIAETGLFKAIEQATFGDVGRKLEEGRGIEGIVTTDPGYFNPLLELMREASYA